MKYLKQFNESEVKTFKNTNEDIQYFFTDYTDEDPEALTITDALLLNGEVIANTTYMKNPSKYRRCKIIKLVVGRADGIETINDGRCFTSFDIIKNAVADIERFYALSGEEVNYNINMEYDELVITFITVGDNIKEEETDADKIDVYLKKIGDCIKRKGHKKQSIKGNWLDIRFSKKDNYDIAVSNKLSKIASGLDNLDNTTNEIDREIIEVRNDAWENGLKMSLSGGDQQVVVKFIKR